MADQTLFQKLSRLFSNDVIIRNIGNNQIKVIDSDRIQTAGNLATNRYIDRYNRVYGTMAPAMSYNQGILQQNFRLEMFRDYEIMDTDSIIASALDIYADDACAKNEYGNVLTIKTSNQNVAKVLNNLFYDVLNIEFNLWPLIRSLCKYGDFFWYLELAERYGVVGATPLSTYEIIREEKFDPERPNLIRFRQDPVGVGARQFIAKAQGETYQNYEIAHFRLLTDSNFLPYGRSMIEPARKVWKQITMMEDAMLIHRIMRAPSKRIFKIDIGNIPPNEVDNYMEQIITKMKKVPYVDENTGDYNLRFNLQNMVEDFYFPVRGGDSGTSIDTLEGMEYTGIDDINYLKNRMLAALKIPKSFLNYEEDMSGKASLAAEDVRYAKTVERIQRIVTSELTKIALIHLYIQGFDGNDLIDFEISLTPPSMVFQQEKINLWSSQMELTQAMIESKMFPKDFIYAEVWKLSDEEIVSMKEGVVQDAKDEFRIQQITEEGNDPVKTGKSYGTPHDLAALYKSPTGDDPNDGKFMTFKGDDKGGSPPGGQPGAGRPPIPGTYKTQDNVYGRDPLGAKENNPQRAISFEQLAKYRVDKKQSLMETYHQPIETSTPIPSGSFMDPSQIIDTDDLSDIYKLEDE